MDWNDLRFVLAVHRGMSLTAAARTLGVDKATVGRRIGALEGSLGIRLFERRPDGLAPTARGARVVASAEKMSTEVASLAADLAHETGLTRVTVRLTAPQWFASGVVIPALPRFQKEHPSIEVVLVESTSVVNLAQRDAEVAVRNVKPAQVSMSGRKAGDLMSALYGSRSYLERVGSPTRRDDVLRHRLLGYERRLSFLPGFDWLAGAGDRAVALRVSDTLSLAAGVRAGLGLAVLPIFVGDRDLELVRIACVEPEVETIWLVTPTELRRTRAVRAAMDFMADLFRSHRDVLSGGKTKLR
jgi:DNA-binding transcriptional LysR family regulator